MGLAICRQIIDRHGGSIELLTTNRPESPSELYGRHLGPID
jgi:nitrogen fixation/metabolism regulation signal transduction histidine kinase